MEKGSSLLLTRQPCQYWTQPFQRGLKIYYSQLIWTFATETSQNYLATVLIKCNKSDMSTGDINEWTGGRRLAEPPTPSTRDKSPPPTTQPHGAASPGDPQIRRTRAGEERTALLRSWWFRDVFRLSRPSWWDVNIVPERDFTVLCD